MRLGSRGLQATFLVLLLLGGHAIAQPAAQPAAPAPAMGTIAGTATPSAAMSGSAPDAGGFDAGLTAQVLTSGLSFMAPRILDPVSVPQLTLWGLHGIAAIDPGLAVDERSGNLLLTQQDHVLLTLAVPPGTEPAPWAQATAQIMQMAWSVSAPLRAAGTLGLVQSFYDELFNHLDPYSRYVAPADADTDREHRTGDAGIGATLAWRGRALVVVSVLAGGPAAGAAIRPGEQLVSIDGQSLAGLDLDAVNARLAGQDGDDVVLGIRDWRGRRPILRSVTVTRASVPPETVFAGREGAVLTIRITGFAADTAARFLRELTLGMARRPAGLVIDLRGNRGGLLRQSVDAAGAVLADAIVSVTVGRDPQADHIFRAEGPDLTSGLPIVVLVDGRSASAAEIMAAALADQRRAVVVGSATLGKGLVQTIAPMPDGGELFVTWSRVLAPSGWPLQGLGVLPQVCTSLGEAALNQQLDDLARGQQDMEAALARHQAARAPIPPASVIALRNACPAAIGRDSDVTAARFLLDHELAYGTALAPAAAGATPPEIPATP